jgi:multiple sugar transport system permease protein
MRPSCGWRSGASRRCSAQKAGGELGTATQYPLKLAAAVLMTIPVAVVFFVFQKYIMRTSEGAVKE